MTRSKWLAIVPPLALLGACGGGQEIVTTNANNVVLNDAHANFAFSNDGETTANEAPAMNGTMANGTAP
jgi:hypothetical protein